MILTILQLASLIPTALRQRSEQGRVIQIPEVGGLHHRYERRAA